MPVLRPVLFPSRLIRLLALCGLIGLLAGLHHPAAPGDLIRPADALALDPFTLLRAFGMGVTLWIALGGVRRTADLLAPLIATALAIIDAVAHTHDPTQWIDPRGIALVSLGAVLAVALLGTARERLRRPLRRSAH